MAYKNPEDQTAHNKAYYAAHKEELSAYNRQYWLDHKEELSAYNRAYYAANKEEISAKNKIWRQAHTDEIRESNRQWRANNREKERERSRKKAAKAKKENPEKVRQQAAAGASTRRARRRNAPIREDVQRLEVAERGGWICHLCDDPIDPNASYQLENGKNNPWYLNIDHVIPLSKGGEHSYANCKPAHARCNNRKWNKMSDELDEAA